MRTGYGEIAVGRHGRDVLGDRVYRRPDPIRRRISRLQKVRLRAFG